VIKNIQLGLALAEKAREQFLQGLSYTHSAALLEDIIEFGGRAFRKRARRDHPVSFSRLLKSRRKKK